MKGWKFPPPIPLSFSWLAPSEDCPEAWSLYTRLASSHDWKHSLWLTEDNPLTQKILRVVGAECWELGTKTKYVSYDSMPGNSKMYNSGLGPRPFQPHGMCLWSRARGANKSPRSHPPSPQWQSGWAYEPCGTVSPCCSTVDHPWATLGQTHIAWEAELRNRSLSSPFCLRFSALNRAWQLQVISAEEFVTLLQLGHVWGLGSQILSLQTVYPKRKWLQAPRQIGRRLADCPLCSSEFFLLVHPSSYSHK